VRWPAVGSTAARTAPRGRPEARGREPGRAAAAGPPATNASLLHMHRSMIESVMVSMDDGRSKLF
jgi:hypothetical protein